MIKKILQNKSLPFLIIRYVTYIVSFLKINLLALELGPHTYGSWGFIRLIWQYLGFLTLGIHFSVNVLIASNKDDNITIKKLSNAALSITTVMFMVLLAASLLIFLFDVTPFEKYEIGSLIIATVAIGMLKNINITSINIARNFDKLYTIGFYYFISEFLIIFIIKVFNKQDLLSYVIYATLVIELAYSIIFVVNHKFRFKFTFDRAIINVLITRGVKLLLYNYSLVFMFMSVRTIVAYYYNVEEFGEYTFANSLVDALFVAFASVIWVFFPKMITKLSGTKGEESVEIISQLRAIYIPLMFFAILLIGFATFIMIYIFPEYKLFKEIFILMLLALGLRDYAFGFNTVIIAKGKEIELAKYALIAIVLNVLFSVFIGITGGELTYIPFITMIASFVYSLIVIFISRKIIGEHHQFKRLIHDWKVFLPIFLLIFFHLTDEFTVINYSIVVLLYFSFNIKSIYSAIISSYAVFIKGTI